MIKLRDMVQTDGFRDHELIRLRDNAPCKLRLHFDDLFPADTIRMVNLKYICDDEGMNIFEELETKNIVKVQYRKLSAYFRNGKVSRNVSAIAAFDTLFEVQK